MKLFSSFKSETVDKNYPMATFASLFIGLEGQVMFFLSLKTSTQTVLIITLCYSLLMLFTFFYTIIRKTLDLFYFNSGILMFGLETSFLITGGTDGFGIVWISLFPLFTIYLFKLKPFILINVITQLILVLALWTPLNRFVYDFSASFEFRYPIAYLVEFIFGTFLKYRMEVTENSLEKQKKLLEKEIELASVIQQSFYKQNMLEFKGWNIDFYSVPMAGVTGDLYDIYSTKNILNGVGMFDVSGHGISSGLVTMLVKNIIMQEFYADENENAAEIVYRINNRVISEKGSIENYLTGILLKIEDKKVSMANAGHPSPVIYRHKTEKLYEWQKDSDAKGAIGIAGWPVAYKTQYEEFESGDEIILYTDGIPDTKNTKGESLGKELFMQLLQDCMDEPFYKQIPMLVSMINSFRSETKPVDDLTIMVLQRL